MVFKSKAAKTAGELPGKKIKSPWTFKAPSYDDRNHVTAGDHYGTGKKAPIGRERSGSVGHGPIPQKKLSVPPKKVG